MDLTILTLTLLSIIFAELSESNVPYFFTFICLSIILIKVLLFKDLDKEDEM